jgi:hypothetical protein
MIGVHCIRLFYDVSYGTCGTEVKGGGTISMALGTRTLNWEYRQSEERRKSTSTELNDGFTRCGIVVS